MLNEGVIALDALGVAVGNDKGDLVLQEIDTAALQHEVKPVGVLFRVAGRIELVHLLGSGGDEQVAVRTLLDLSLERAGGVEVAGDGHTGVCGLVQALDLRHRFGHGGGGEDDELDLFGGGGLFGGDFGCGGGRSGLLTAGCQREDHHQRQQQCKGFLHVVSSFPSFREKYL